MATCSTCGAELPIAVRFCSSCGAPVGSDDLATLEFATAASPRPLRPASSSSSRPPSSSGFALNEGRFLPGRLLAGRYRIIALLGKGGMGEVYRADDLTLGQPVALKFLPEEASRDESLLERFRNEVRIARRVSHPNVCRVYDVGEVDGHTFFTMEYVDGEDLASLLRRIGRLPPDKATDIARQLCAGLAAAHSKGVLHRDLKPANIMLDGRGQVVMTDFGLAGLTDQIQGADVRSGTPAYMAPEQLAGKEVTAQSDIYALGLVLYEVFTGKRAFTAETLAELVRTGAQSAPSRPSSVVKDLDPAVERVILRCLEPEPRNRPASALSVAAALPGGDPLAAALAAGETPSPQMVAAAGESGGLSPRVALSCLAAVLIGLAATVYLTIRPNTLERIGVELSPEVLSQKAHEIITRFGYAERPADSASGFFTDSDFTDYVEKNDKPRPNWDEILVARPSPMAFWYRQSPDYLVARDFHDFLLTPGLVDGDDPPSTLSGMIRLVLDARGRLTYFDAIPAQVGTAQTAPAHVDWNALFAAAELDPAQFQPAQPTWTSLAAADTRAAWIGKWPGTGRDLRIEAAAWQGKPVFFSLIGAWTKPDRMKQEPPTVGKKWGQVLGVLLLASLMLFSFLLARRNYRHGRGDRDGATLLATVVFGLLILLWLFRGHLVPGMGTFGLLIFAIAMALFLAALTWVMYMAVEPYVRRYWPHSIISWSRLLTARVRDPLVGSDILFGVLLGVIWIAIFQTARLIAMRMGAAPPFYSSSYLSGTRQAMGMWLSQIPGAIIATLEFFFLLLGLRLLLRKDWLAAIAFMSIFSSLKSLGSSYPAVEIPTTILVYSIAALVVFRFGLVSLACAIFTVDLLVNVPFSADLAAWYMSTSIFALLSVVALAGWGFYTSLGGEPLWKPDL
jgi:tRNA A-37 threonylcarbamoyl transferase component Bud32